MHSHIERARKAPMVIFQSLIAFGAYILPICPIHPAIVKAFSIFK